MSASILSKASASAADLAAGECLCMVRLMERELHTLHQWSEAYGPALNNMQQVAERAMQHPHKSSILLKTWVHLRS